MTNNPISDAVLLLAGSSGTGKTHAAATIARRLGLQHQRLDDLWIVARRLVTAQERPSLHALNDIHSVLKAPLDDLHRLQREITTALTPALETFIAMYLSRSQGAIFEGVWIDPALASQASFDGVAANGRVRAVAVHEADEVEIYESMRKRGDFGRYSEEEQHTLAALSFRYGEQIRREAEAVGIPVIEARPQETLPERVSLVAGFALP